jgi:hypothetical protein
MVICGHPFETGFEGDLCRHVQDGPRVRFVTRALKIFPRGLFELRLRFGMTVAKRCFSVFFPSNLSVSVRRNKNVRPQSGLDL